MIFLWIGVAGILFLVLASLIGDHGGGELSGGDVGHDFGHDFSHDAGLHTSAEQDASASGPSPLSMRSISIFVTVFGFAGFLAKHYGVSGGIATVIGIVAGLALAALTFQFIKLLYAQQGSSVISQAELVGQQAEVINAIPKDGLGEVTVRYRNQLKTFLARSNGELIPRGAKVKIIEDLGSSIRVSSVNN